MKNFLVIFLFFGVSTLLPAQKLITKGMADTTTYYWPNEFSRTFVDDEGSIFTLGFGQNAIVPIYSIQKRNRFGEILLSKDIILRGGFYSVPTVSNFYTANSRTFIDFNIDVCLVLDSLFQPVNAFLSNQISSMKSAGNNELICSVIPIQKEWEFYQDSIEIHKRISGGGLVYVDSNSLVEWELLLGNVEDSMLIDTSTNDTIAYFQGGILQSARFNVGDYVVDNDTIYGFASLFDDSTQYILNYKLNKSGDNLSYKMFSIDSDIEPVNRSYHKFSNGEIRDENLVFTIVDNGYQTNGTFIYSFDKDLNPVFGKRTSKLLLGVLFGESDIHLSFGEGRNVYELVLDKYGDLTNFESHNIIDSTFQIHSGFFTNNFRIYNGVSRKPNFFSRNRVTIESFDSDGSCDMDNEQLNFISQDINFQMISYDLFHPPIHMSEKAVNIHPSTMPFSDMLEDRIVQDSIYCYKSLDETENTIEIGLYPNPAQNWLNIDSDLKIENVQIFSTKGDLINESQTNTIYIEHLSSGIYLVSVSAGSRVFNKKFIKI